jgi:hypothetical protein
MLAAAITINTIADSDARDASLTLREAILINNRTLSFAALTAQEQAQVVGTSTAGDTDTIRFNIPGFGPHTISPTSALPSITDPVTIDGYTQPGAIANSNAPSQALNTLLKIELAGNLTPASTGLRLAAGSGGSSIRGLAVNRFANNLWIDTHGNTIAGNFVGTNITGTAAMPGGNNGVLLISAANNTIGGTNPADGNLISGNATNGITIVETGANNNVIRGNRIGTDITGTVDLGNAIFGIYLYRALNTVIGGNTAAAQNLISGNNNSGIWMEENSHDTMIQGNLIGTSLSGTQELPNSNHGINIIFGSRTVIGGLASGEGNVIAGSGNIAINIQNGVGPMILGNWIGTDVSGTIDLGNLGGISLASVRNSIIKSNTIAFNGSGIQINGNTFGDPETGNLVSQNSIYSNTADVAIDLYSSFETIGPNFPQDATDADSGANNHQNFPIITSVTDLGGMTRIEGTLASQLNSSYRLEFFASAMPTSSGFGPGQTYLGEHQVAIGDGSNTVSFMVDLPAIPLGQTLITATATDITNTGSGPRNDTSEFSPAVAIDTAFTVTSTADQGAGSLRQALVAANFVDGLNTITFNIPASDPNHFYYRDDGIAGRVTQANISTTSAANDTSILDIDPDWAHSWFSIELDSKLSITDEVVIDGYTQPGTSGNTNPVGQGLNSILRVEINGEHATGIAALDGLIHVDTSDATIRGLVVNRPAGLQTSGMHVQLRSGTANTIEGNYIGTDVSGTYSYPLGFNTFPPVFAAIGVYHNPTGSISGHLIGGTSPAARNLLSGTSAGVAFLDTAPNNIVQGNLIGTDRSGTKDVGNRVGVWIESVGITVGGAIAGAGNVISGNERAIEIGDFAGNSHDNIVQNNWIGTDVTGTGELGNDSGVVVAARNNEFRGNRIAFNAGPGVVIGHSATGNLISQNSIHSNETVGIDLGSNGLTLNDEPPATNPPDQDTGANNLQNFPTLTSVIGTGAGTQVQGTLLSVPNSLFRIEFFANRERDEGIYIFGNDDIVPGMFAEGQTYLGFINVMTNASGAATISANIPELPMDQDFVTATATDISNDGNGPRNHTSEFSPIYPKGGHSTGVVETGDVGVGTLREAMFVAQFPSQPDIITFSIPANDPHHFYYRNDGVSGQVSRSMVATTTAANDASISDVDPDWAHSWYSIELDRALPAIFEPVTIDGFTQAGSSLNTLAALGGLNTVLKIEIDGSNVASNGLRLVEGADLSLIQGLVINRFGGNGIFLDSSGFHRVYGNFIGTDVSGTIALGNGGNGVLLQSGVNRIGGATPSARNLISGNSGNGVRDRLAGSNVYQGNLIGVDRTANHFLFNGAVGIFLDKQWFTTIGGTTPGTGNVIATSGADAILLSDELYPGLGLSETLLASLEPLRDAAQDALDAREQFFATNWREDAISLLLTLFELVAIAEMEDINANQFYAQGNMFLGNHIFVEQDNVSTLGIDLAGNGVTANDAMDTDGGPNNLRNYPVLTSAIATAGTTAVSGILNSVPNVMFRVELFASSELLASGRGPGQRYLGFVEIATNGSGNATFNTVLPFDVPVGQFITATATYLLDLDENAGTPPIPLETSEFSAGIVVTQAGGLIGDYNRNGVVDSADYVVWRNTVGQQVANFSGADGSGNGLIDNDDYNIWRANFGATLLLAGDYNGNGVVDAADYVAWRNTLGQSAATRSGADGNGNGVVDGEDYNTWRANFGAASANAAGSYSQLLSSVDSRRELVQTDDVGPTESAANPVDSQMDAPGSAIPVVRSGLLSHRIDSRHSARSSQQDRILQPAGEPLLLLLAINQVSNFERRSIFSALPCQHGGANANNLESTTWGDQILAAALAEWKKAHSRTIITIS